MIAELGLLALWLAAGLSGFQLFAAILAGRGAAVLGEAIRPVAVMQGLLAAFAFAMLVWLFARTDLSVALVAQHSHSAKPFVYKLSGAWANHEGSMLLWVMVMAFSGALVALFERRLSVATMRATLGAQAIVTLGFYAFLLISSNPFERLATPAVEGNGLNPLLQDPGLAFHPPTLYFGYVGLSVAFSFAVGALVTGEVGRDFARTMRSWVLAAWVFLTLGIAAGSWWAYYELGWGGWWFWDPVENASLMPWLAATALFHSTSVLASRDALRVWTVMLAVVAFSMAMVGTFLVRSGVLTSVHAFAVDPERGTFILVLLGIFIGGALALFALRAGKIAEGSRFSWKSREASLVVNNVLLTALLGIVLLGTLYPLLTESMGTRVSVGPPYFNPVGAIFFFPLVLAMMVGPLLRWRDTKWTPVVQRLAPAFAAMAFVALLVVIDGRAGLLSGTGLVLAAGLALASLLPLARRKPWRAPLTLWGMVVAHFGLAVTLAGASAESAFIEERLVSLTPGESTRISGWDVTLRGTIPVAGPNWTAIEGELAVSRDGAIATILSPQRRSFWSPPQTTTEAALWTRWNGQLYAVLGEPAESGKRKVRLWWKPFVTLIWYGALLVALGGLLALSGRARSALRRSIAVGRATQRREVA
ncbi:MAG: heme lyase NrfEFG subunit NrfE [Sphingomonadales bacterium CG12_big_fil_rev_8_21_14_0_65_65_10]|uniref:Cytochrome c biogenesis protein CcmF n=1 Tax=Blastomonas marina TaxID=1867408 RepID=A0ABQ1FD76_9SPHN|nr:heme lyase CcmF/NrfE family subunit [Blastomonas marina]PIW56584.1 MAG: heme lyase NrfEFG subunit NrfE [Sphingomonadales bacterium CG12_big_fil_rev_8_21_14_0_65_65_10]GGA05649.1 cytochrome c biogenesis protein CcmF [Blastomonas marina]